ncbi:MAG: CNNM domain-containing protein [Flavobacteriales bacterium]|nr:CNNM domain-containing protein [Flavobacteriales bacterium]
MEPPSVYHLATLALIAPAPSAWVALGALLLLLPVHALLAGMRTALHAAAPTELQVMKERGIAGADRALELRADPGRALMALRVAITMIVVAITVLAAFLLMQLTDLRTGAGVALFIGGLALTVLLLLVSGEVVPKAWVDRDPARVAIATAGILWVLRALLGPLGNALIALSGRLGKPRDPAVVNGAASNVNGTADTEDAAGEKRILRGVARFAETEVKQVMRPRTEVVAFDQAMSFTEMVPAVIESGFSRVPIFNGSLDQVTGILYLKDLLPLMRTTEMDWHGLLRKPYFVAESMPLDRLLREFQKLKVHLAVVVDEYGATSGIITLEDVIEEIVGDITDEYDDDDHLFTRVDDHTFIFEGRTPLPDVYRALDSDGHDFEEQRGDSGTLGGLITELAGRIPRKGEQVELGPYVLRVEASDNKRVRRVKVQVRQ